MHSSIDWRHYRVTANTFARSISETPHNTIRLRERLFSVDGLASVVAAPVRYGRIHRDEHLKEWSRDIDMMFEAAVLAQSQGRGKSHQLSWRNFYVGCSVLAYRYVPDTCEHQWKILTGVNMKVEDDPTCRPTCAEVVAVQSALAQGYSEVIGMVVVGEPQPDQASGRLDSTLHPCGECRRMMQHHPLIKPHTRILAARPDRTNHEVFTVRGLTALHKQHPRSSRA